MYESTNGSQGTQRGFRKFHKCFKVTLMHAFKLVFMLLFKVTFELTLPYLMQIYYFMQWNILMDCYSIFLLIFIISSDFNCSPLRNISKYDLFFHVILVYSDKLVSYTVRWKLQVLLFVNYSHPYSGYIPLHWGLSNNLLKPVHHKVPWSPFKNQSQRIRVQHSQLVFLKLFSGGWQFRQFKSSVFVVDWWLLKRAYPLIVAIFRVLFM